MNVQENELKVEEEQTGDNQDVEQDAVQGEEGKEEEVITEDEVIIEGEEESEPEDETQLVKKLRGLLKEKEKELKGYRTKIPKEEGLRPRPKLEDFDYDPELYDAELDKWYQEKIVYDSKQSEKQKYEDAVNQDFQKKLNNYEVAKSQLNKSDYDEIEAIVDDELTVAQRAIIIKNVRNAALFFYAIGKNPNKLSQLAKMHDLAEFTYNIAKLEEQIKMAKKLPPSPEKRISTGTPFASNALERLRAEADKTGDYSKVLEYRRKNKQ